MRRLLALRRARKAVDRAADLYDLARFVAREGKREDAAILREQADKAARKALDALKAVARYLPPEAVELHP